MKEIKSVKSIDKINERLDAIEREEEEIQEQQKKKMTPEEHMYQAFTKAWYFHESSYYVRGANGYDGYGCNSSTGCIPECRYYPEEGRIEGEEWKASRKQRKNKS